MAEPYDRDKHPTPPWSWHDDAEIGDGAGYWQLDDSAGGETDDDEGDRRGFECVQYTYAKVQGRRPLRDDPHRAEEASKVFEDLGYARVDCGQCGCGDGRCKDCIVIYSAGDGGAHHVAAFDPRLCDWGGKLHGSGPIVRFKRPQDFMRPRQIGPDGTETRPADTMACYCKRRETPGPYISDIEMRQGFSDEAAPAPRSLGGSLIRLILDFLRWLADLFRPR